MKDGNRYRRRRSPPANAATGSRIDPEANSTRTGSSRLVAKGRAELAGRPAPIHAVAALEAALALWRASPLADLAYEPFAQEEIARLEELHLGAVEQRIDADLATGRHADVFAELEALIGRHPSVSASAAS